MSAGFLNYSSQSFGCSLLLHSLLLLVLIFGLPAFFHKPVTIGPDEKAIDISVMTPEEFNIILQPHVVPVGNTPVKTESLPPKVESTPSPPQQQNNYEMQSQKALVNPQAVTTALSAEEIAQEEKRKKEKMRSQSLIFSAGHAVAPIQQNLPPAAANLNASAGTYNHSWR